MLCASLTATNWNNSSEQHLGQIDRKPASMLTQHAVRMLRMDAMLGRILGDLLTEPARKGRALLQAPDNGNLLVVDGNIYRGQACSNS